MDFTPIKICMRLGKITCVQGSVHSVFNKVMNINTEWGLVPVLTRNVPMQPNSVKIDYDGNLSEIFSQGQRVKWEYNFRAVPSWDSRPRYDLVRNISDCSAVSASIKRTLKKYGKFDGIATAALLFDEAYENKTDSIGEIYINYYTEVFYPRSLNFIRAMNDKKLAEINAAAMRLIGFGPGLTPSADDFLTGFMIFTIYESYLSAALYKALTICKGIEQEAINRTTDVSYEMLKYASNGQVAENIQSLMNSIFCKDFSDNYIDNIEKAVVSVLENGETSGSDLIAGVFAACKNYERTVLNGS